MVKLFDHQVDALKSCEGLNRVAFYHDMGLGKTFTGAEKLVRLNGRVNLVICQKSKIDDWLDHFKQHYSSEFSIHDLTKKRDFSSFIAASLQNKCSLGIINYDLVFRRKEIASIQIDTIMLDESSLIQNETSKRSKFILKKLCFKNIVLLSGTPTNGKYENLWSQLHLLGWEISKDLFWKHYIDYEWQDQNGFPLKVVKGYKNVERLKRKLREHGAQFLKTDEVMNLPDKIEQKIQVPVIKQYHKFRKDSIIEIGDKTLVGDSILTKMLYERQLCGQYNNDKLDALRDIIESTSDRLIIFYNFDAELNQLKTIAEELQRPHCEINGHKKDLEAYERYNDSLIFVQYQSGAMGLNLQKANKIIYFTLPLSSELFEQSKKRIHRIGQNSTCFYYILLCKNSIEERIYETLQMRRDYTDYLFAEDIAR